MVLELLATLHKLKAANDADGANKLADNQFTAALANYGKAVEALSVHERGLIDGSAQAIAQEHDTGRMSLIVLSVVALAVGGLFAWRLTVGIVHPLGQAVKVAESVADGNLASHIEIGSRDETGQLLQALKNMNDSLASIVGEVRSGTDTIASAVERNRRRQPGPVGAHRAAGQLAGRNRRLDGRTDLDRQAERRQRAPGQPAGASRPPRSRSRAARWSAQVVDTMGSINASVAQDRRHHRRDRRHRLPDQYPGAERGGGSGARRRAGPRLRGGGRRGAQPGAALGRGGQGDQGA